MASEIMSDSHGGHHSEVAKVAHAVLRGVIGTVENITHRLLAITSLGKKQTLPDIKDKILLLSASALAEKIRTGECKSVDVVKAYISRITDVNNIINAVVDRRFKAALEEAERVDQLVQSATKTPEQLAAETPFLGVPFSSKEAVLVDGLSATCGLVCRKGMTAHRDSDAVSMLRKAGAIPLVVTNTSEVCMWWETYNKLHGKTNNPYDTTKTAGGSTGGEAALIAAAGSVIGLGTDLGGSIRLPSFFCGVFGHKPSTGVVPTGGQFPPVKEHVSPFAVTGPIARYATDLRLMLRILAGQDLATKIKIDEKVNLKSIKVYYMMNDGGSPLCAPISPEVRDCLKNVIFWLKDSGVNAQNVRLDALKYGLFIWCRFLAEIKDQTIANLMTGDVKSKEDLIPPHQEMLKWISGKSDHTFPLIFNACVHEYVAPRVLSPMGFFIKMSHQLKKQIISLLGEDGVLLYPSFPSTAPYHGELFVNPMNVSYNVVFNALGFPVTQCCLGLGPSGLPVGLQVIAAPMQDRLTLSVAEELEKQFGGWVNPSQPS